MPQTLLTARRPNFEKASTVFFKTTIPKIPSHSRKVPEKLRKEIAKLERLDIGRLDILKAMANITEQWGDEQVAEILEATAISLKRNRRVIRDI